MRSRRVLLFVIFLFGLMTNLRGEIIFDQALRLYERGFYERAKELFDKIPQGDNHSLVDAYSLLCALKMDISEGDKTIASYINTYPYSPLIPQIYFVHGENYFAKKEYQKALDQFNQVDRTKLYERQIPFFDFKKAYSYFVLGDLQSAKIAFLTSLKNGIKEYEGPSHYALAYISYTKKEFNQALEFFQKARKDPRFEQMADYYILECRFMLKDYNYVAKNGPEIFTKVPEERKKHLSRILSESFLILGKTEQAKDYLNKNLIKEKNVDRKDLFHAGSVLFASGDYKGAIENYSAMPVRYDSIGQIANYNLAYAYIKTKNKVAALNSFKEASELNFDEKIKEDAFFNYAKLAFDLNKDPKVFERYIAKYKNRQKEEIIYSYIALAALYNRDYLQAITAYDNIEELDDDMIGNYIKANYLKANELIKKSAYRDAVHYLKTAIYYSDKNSYFNQLARFWLAESYYKGRRFSEAIEIYRDLYNLSALDGISEGDLIPYNLAYAYFNKGEYNQAAKWFDVYLRNNDVVNRKDAIVRRADCEFVQKRYEQAAKFYAKVQSDFVADPNDVYPYYQEGIAYGLLAKKNLKITALSRVKQASSNLPYYAEAYYEYAHTLANAGKKAEAKAEFSNLCQNVKDTNYLAKSLMELGMLERNDKNYATSLAYYKEVVNKMGNTEYAETALTSIENIYQRMGKPELYVAFIDSLGTSLNKNDKEKEDVLFAATEQIFLNENYEKAIPALEDFLQRYPETSQKGKINFYLAESFRKISYKDQAIDKYKEVLAENDSSYRESASYNLASLAFDMQRYQEAYEAYKYLSENYKFEEYKEKAIIGLMRASYLMKDSEKAIEAAEKVEETFPKNKELLLEAKYVKAQAYLISSQRDKALEIFEILANDANTEQGAEASYLLIQDLYDRGEFEQIKAKVYAFAEKAGGQNYWLAKSFIVLGDSFAELDNMAQAKATFESILNGYKPEDEAKDDVLPLVKSRLSKIQELQ